MICTLCTLTLFHFKYLQISQFTINTNTKQNKNLKQTNKKESDARNKIYASVSHDPAKKIVERDTHPEKF